MVDATRFRNLLQRVRQGDEEGVATLVGEYEPHIRRVVRFTLTDRSLRQRMDSVDVCQSVLADFLFRCRMGQFELETSEDLVKLLVAMARNKVKKRRDQHYAARRDVRRTRSTGFGRLPTLDTGDSPSQIAMTRELVQLAEARLTAEERYLIDERRSGRPWADLSQALQQDANALRSRLSRAVERVSAELGLNGEASEND